MKKIKQQTLDELDGISKEHDGRLTPEIILAWARAHKKSYIWLHELEHNVNKALVLYHLEQCRRLIMGAWTELTNAEGKQVVLRRFVSLPHDRADRTGYREIRDVISSQALRQQMVEAAHSDAEAFQYKYEMLEEFAPVVEGIKKVKRRVSKKKRA